MFDRLIRTPPDAILQLMLDCEADPNPKKVDLSAGVYKDASGITPVMDSVREAQLRRISSETTKTYTGIAGDPRFNQLLPELVLGSSHAVLGEDRVNCVQAPGGSGALRIAAELIADASPEATIWLSDPSWANHPALLGNTGLSIKRYPYYDQQSHSILFDQMCSALQSASEGDVLVLHGSCHNPCGADLSLKQWQSLTNLVLEKKLVPLIDVAYHGMAAPLEQEAAGWRGLLEQVPEALVAYSCSKIFGIYRERTGALLSISENASAASITLSNLLSIIRQIYSVPPAHGAFLVAEILDDAELKSQWLTDLEEVRMRILSMRELLANALSHKTGSDYSFIARERGMFSFLGVTDSQVEQLANEHSVYVLGSSRISVAGVTEANVDYIAAAVAAVSSQIN